jgi:hypothetical protein
VARFHVYFVDGPCKNKPRYVDMGEHPDATIACGGATYTFRGAESASPGAPSAVTLFYAVSGGQYDNSIEHIRGERDLFRAWSNLRTAMRRTTGGEVKRTRAAGRRIRRAVK